MKKLFLILSIFLLIGAGCNLGNNPNEKSKINEQQNLALNDWDTYTNAKYSFKYPKGWIVDYQEFKQSDEVLSVASITPNKPVYDFSWGIWEHQNTDIETLISKMGGQVNNRKEKRESITVDGKPAIKVTVTTSDIENWSSIMVFVTLNNSLIRIGSTLKDDNFDDFVSSVSFKN